jgi:hypothetical protein
LELVLQLAEPELQELYQECEQFVVIALAQLRQEQLELLVLFALQNLLALFVVGLEPLPRHRSYGLRQQKYLEELQALVLVEFRP